MSLGYPVRATVCTYPVLRSLCGGLWSSWRSSGPRTYRWTRDPSAMVWKLRETTGFSEAPS